MPIPKKNEPIAHKSAKEIVFQQMREWIIVGQLASGEQLYDAQLAEYFQVSRTPIREAFLLLESQGLISTLPGRATIVTEISKEKIHESYIPLATLQGLAAELSCELRTEEHLEKLRKKNKSFRQAASSGNTLKIISADAIFHEYLTDVSGNKYVSDYCRILLAHVARIEHFFFSGQRDAERSAKTHDTLIDMIEKRDKSAGEYLRNDWLETMRSCEKWLLEQ